jgi:hypothetical protein
MAVACSDPYVRVFDRRKLSLISPHNVAAAGTEPLMKLAPAHLALGVYVCIRTLDSCTSHAGLFCRPIFVQPPCRVIVV